MAQNYASYNNQPVSRMSFLRHQFKPSQNALGDSSLIGYWPLSEGTGTVAYDESGKGGNSGWAGAMSGTNGYYSSGKTSSFAGFFNNSNNSITLNNPPAFSGALTYVAWINGSSFSGARMALFDATSGMLGTNLGSAAFARMYLSGGTAINAGTVSTNAWHLLVATRDGAGNVTLFLDAVSVGTVSGQTLASSPVFIGGHGSQLWTGMLQSIRFYNRALTQSEIQAIYNGENH
jgi:hypothetical protein